MNKALRALFVAQSLNVLADNLLIPVFALLVLEGGGNAEAAGLLWSIQFFVSATVGFVLTKIKDSPGLNYRLLRINYLIKGIVWLVLVISHTLPSLAVAQAVLGLCRGVGSPSLGSLISEHLDSGKHISDWSYLGVISDLLVVISGIFGGFIVAQIGFTPLFAVMGTIELAVFVFLLINKRHFIKI